MGIYDRKLADVNWNNVGRALVVYGHCYFNVADVTDATPDQVARAAELMIYSPKMKIVATTPDEFGKYELKVV